MYENSNHMKRRIATGKIKKKLFPMVQAHVKSPNATNTDMGWSWLRLNELNFPGNYENNNINWEIVVKIY